MHLFMQFCVLFLYYIGKSQAGFYPGSIASILNGNPSSDVKDLNLLDLQKWNNEGSSKPEVVILFESLCPFCREFFVKEMPKVMKDLGQYIDLKIYPYGNAQMRYDPATKEEVITCQHGEAECYGNKLDACTLEYYNIDVSVKFISCMMDRREDHGSNNAAAETCGKKMEVDAGKIEKCAAGPMGHKLLVQYGKLTSKIQHNGVPFPMVNGKHVDDLYAAICNALQNPPSSCKNPNQ